ncbi:MAG: hypothetical protein ACLR0U_31045 [Enterocloster clostridioformis]
MAAIEAEADCVFYIGASVDGGYGTPFFRAFNPRLPLGEIHQIHGKGVGQRGFYDAQPGRFRLPA